jgi:hypothetical protein
MNTPSGSRSLSSTRMPSTGPSLSSFKASARARNC